MSSAVSLFLALLSHLTWVGGAGGGAGLTSLALLSLTASLTTGPLMLTSAELAPVHHIPWAMSLTSAIIYSAELVTIMMFPIAMEVIVVIAKFHLIPIISGCPDLDIVQNFKFLLYKSISNQSKLKLTIAIHCRTFP